MIVADKRVIDVQVNGGWAELEGKGRVVDFSDPNLSRDEVFALAKSYADRGVYLVPTIITADNLVAARNAATIVEAIGNEPIFAGIHLEGPHLSPLCRGAHPVHCLRDPNIEDFRRIYDAAKGNIVLTTVAPELPGALSFIEQVSQMQVVVSAGHHAANPQQLKDSFNAGITALTHAGNAWLSPNAENFAAFGKKSTEVYDQLQTPGIFVMIIPDGRHVSANFIRMCHDITRNINPAKGYQRFVITSDASPAEGAPDGSYNVFVNLGIKVTEDNLNGFKQTIPLSGSWLDLRKCMHVLAEMKVDSSPIISVPEIEAAASTNVLEMLRSPLTRLGRYDTIKDSL